MLVIVARLLARIRGLLCFRYCCVVLHGFIGCFSALLPQTQICMIYGCILWVFLGDFSCVPKLNDYFRLPSTPLPDRF